MYAPTGIKRWRKRTPTVIQMEAVECGPASLGIILGFFGHFVPLEELRLACGVSRDGSNALNLIKAAEKYGLEGKGLSLKVPQVYTLETPAILFWEFNHFLVLEGVAKDKIFVNDPASGPRTVTYEEFDQGYTGVALIFEPKPEFKAEGRPPSLFQEILRRLKKAHFPLIYVFLAGFCLLLPGLAFPAFTRIFVDEILVNHLFPWKVEFVLSVFLATAFGGTLIWLQQYFLNRLNGRLSIQFSSEFLWHILRLPVAFYTQRFPGEIAWRVSLNDAIAQMMTGTLATTCIDLFLVVFYGVVMIQYDPVIGSIGLSAALVNIAVFAWIQRSRSDDYARVQQETGKWIGNAIGCLQHIETIKAAGTEPNVFSRFANSYTKNLNAQQEISKKDSLLGTIPVLCQALAIAALLSIGSLRVIEGRLSFGMLMALQTLLLSFLSPIARFVNFGTVLQTMKIDIGRLNDVLKNEIDPVYAQEPELNPELRLEGALEFQNVSFGYSPLAPPLIKSLSFTIKPGQRLALVGPSGCGKSTIAKLAAGLYRPWKGEILYDGKPLSTFPKETFHHSLGTVDQEIFLFSGTIRDNLTLWNPTVTDQMLINATQDACIHDEIILRDKGYDSLLTEGGRNLSGGQRQKLEIARALLYSPSLLIMDEATSSLDSEVEKEIADKIRRKGCSALMIAHRLSTIQDCDTILVLQQGSVIQQGTHQELKEVAGIYQQLIQSENASYG